MNRVLLLLMPTSLCALVALALWNEVPDRIKIDGVGGEVASLFVRMDTEYADGYSHSGFNRISIGMTEREVLSILGEPLQRWQPYKRTRFKEKANYVGLEYSRSPTSKNFRLREVYMDRGVVAEKIGYFYLD